jgi:sorbitol-specific phosphotransferase system component IIBC
MSESIKIECPDCGGTGVYRGMAESKTPGLAVVCLRCSGTGASFVSFNRFVSIKRREGITMVAQSSGTFIGTGVGPVGRVIDYESFFRGEMP